MNKYAEIEEIINPNNYQSVTFEVKSFVKDDVLIVNENCFSRGVYEAFDECPNIEEFLLNDEQIRKAKLLKLKYERELNSRQQLSLLIGEAVLDSLQKAGVSLTIPSEFEKSSSSSNRLNNEELSQLRQRIWKFRQSLIDGLRKKFRDVRS